MAEATTAKQEVKRIEKQKAKEVEKKSKLQDMVAEKLKLPKKEEKKKEKKVLEEKIVTIGLRRIIDSRRTKRASRAIKLIKEKVKRIAKKPVKLSLKLNEKIWKRGIQHPPSKIKIKIKIMEDEAEVSPA